MTLRPRSIAVKSLIVLSLTFLAACSTPAVRCDQHLRPINVPQRTVSGQGSRGKNANASSQSIGVTRASGASP
jgi:hypothetical protein